MSILFSKIVKEMESFEMDKPTLVEAELEDQVYNYLSKKIMKITRQVSEKRDRYDLICEEENEIVCVELKVLTNIKDIKQFDRYLAKFKDGFIVVCYQANFSVKNLFAAVKEQSPFPMELIELSQRYV